MKKHLIEFYTRLQKATWLKPGSEEVEQVQVVRFLEEAGYKFTAIPNSTWTTSHRQKERNFLTGLRSGLCDMLIVLRCKKVLFIEMKKKVSVLKTGKLSKTKPPTSVQQIEWIKALNEVENIQALVCYGANEAIEKIKYYENQ